MWKVYHIAGQRYFDRLLDDGEKKEWESHPGFSGQYRFEPADKPEGKPQPTVAAPVGVEKEVEAKAPKNETEQPQRPAPKKRGKRNRK